MAFDIKRFFRKLKPAMLWGQRLYLKTDPRIPENQLIVLVHPNKFQATSDRLNASIDTLNQIEKDKWRKL